MIFGHGDDAYRYGEQITADFSSNIYFGADLTDLQAYLAERFGIVGHYPEPEAVSLEKMLAKKLGVPEDMIMVTNGATEAIYLIAQLYSGWASIIPQPTFTEYEDACRIYKHLLSYSADNNLEVLPEDRIYWLCNPNNPTGNVLNKHLIRHIVHENPRYLYVVDQSYEDYTLSPVIHPQDMTDCYNLMLVYSLSKKYCIPGLRLGYIFSSPIIIDRLRQIRQPWAVNAIAIEAGKYMVEKDPKLIPDLPAYLAEAQRLRENLSAIDGVMVMDTATHFMLVNIERGNAHDLKKWLIARYGILVREATNFRGLDNHYFRVSARTPEDDDRLVEALKTYLQSPED